MHLKLDWTTESKLFVPNAVAVVTAATYTARGLEAQVRLYKDIASAADGTPSFEDKVVLLPLGADTFAQVVYGLLKEHQTGTRVVDGPPDADGNPTKVTEPVKPFAAAVVVD